MLFDLQTEHNYDKVGYEYALYSIGFILNSYLNE